MKLTELDIIFLSYDEPNADLNYADLCSKVPWAKRIHGVKGSDAAHKAAAELSETEWFVSVDADNIVDPNFFDLELEFNAKEIQVYSWLGKNLINGLTYGNGGLKIWNKQFVLDMKTHESAEDPRANVDFCWEAGYKQYKQIYSEVVINKTILQAWRAGFREGVKMTLNDGLKVDPEKINEKIWWHNLHRLKIWSTVGSHVDNGRFAILGARQGTYMTNCTDWDFVKVRDFDYLNDLYGDIVEPISNVDDEILELGEKLKYGLGFEWPYLDEVHSNYFSNLYQETVSLGLTYYNKADV